MRKEISFENLVASVSQIQELTSGRAKNAVNQLLTIRNWVIGYYIVEFEMNGKNRANYGTHLLKELEKCPAHSRDFSHELAGLFCVRKAE